jgi:hypothetical protein
MYKNAIKILRPTLARQTSSIPSSSISRASSIIITDPDKVVKEYTVKEYTVKEYTVKEYTHKLDEDVTKKLKIDESMIVLFDSRY